MDSVKLAHAMHTDTCITLDLPEHSASADQAHPLVPMPEHAPSRTVHASVRPNGAMMAFYKRTFDLVLTADLPGRMVEEATQILARNGFEAIGVTLE